MMMYSSLLYLFPLEGNTPTFHFYAVKLMRIRLVVKVIGLLSVECFVLSLAELLSSKLHFLTVSDGWKGVQVTGERWWGHNLCYGNHFHGNCRSPEAEWLSVFLFLVSYFLFRLDQPISLTLRPTHCVVEMCGTHPFLCRPAATWMCIFEKTIIQA